VTLNLGVCVFALECGGRPIIEQRLTTMQSPNPPETARDQTWRRLPLINEEIKSSYICNHHRSERFLINFLHVVSQFVCEC
jgi:hypothetical protein